MSSDPPDDGVLPDRDRLPASDAGAGRPGRPSLTAQQQSISDGLGAESPHLAEWFVSAVELTQTQTPVAWISLVAHLCRDLMNRAPRIADVLVEVEEERDEKAARVEYADLVQQVSVALPDELDGEIALTPEATDALRRLVVAHRALNERRAKRQRPADAAGSETARREFDRQWRATQKFFQRLTHLRAKGAPPVSPVEVERQFSILEDLLVTRLRAVPYWTLDEELSKIAELEVPTVEDLRRAMVLWRGDAETAFFEQLSSAVWVPLIVTAGFLERPQGVETSEEGMRLPFWPVSRYLARVAGGAPDVVLAAIERLGPTENGRVHGDLVEALLGMPSATAARAVDLVLGWLGKRWGRFAAESAARLAARLAAGGEPDAALALAKRLVSLNVRVDERDVELGWRVAYDTVFHSDYEYDDALAELLPLLVAAQPIATVKLLASVLGGVLTRERKKRKKEGPEDDSWWWRKAVVDHVQNRPREDARDILVSALRDAAVLAAGTTPDAADAVLAALDGQPHLLFRRIAIHVVRVVDALGSGYPERRRRELLDRSRFDGNEYRNEYFHLVQDRFGELSDEDQETILGWIDTGPDLTKWAGYRPEPPTAEEVAERADFWRYEHLVSFEQHLTGDRAAKFAAYQERFGKLADPDIANPIRVGWGQPSSRYSAADLRAMPTEVLLHTIKTYAPDRSVFPPEMDNGLAVVLGMAIGEDPDYWKSLLVSIASDLPDDYLVAALDAMSTPQDAADEGGWDAALALCERALKRNAADEHRRLAGAAGRVVEAVVRAGSDAPPAQLTAQVMSSLRLLLADPDPGPETDASYAEQPLHGALNTVRARALGTLITLALRLHPDARAIAHPSLTRMPEVRDLLDAHLDPERDPSPLVRAEYGSRLGDLFYLDRPWTTAHLPDIFDSDRPALAEAAWRGYVVRSYIATPVLAPVIATGLYTSHLVVLEDAPPADEDLEAEDVRRRLTDHVAYAWVFDVPGARELLEVLQTTAADANREAFVRNLAFGLLREGDDDVVHGAIPRLVELWRERIDVLPGDSVELAAFSWWYSAGRLPEPGATTLLIATIKKTGGVLDDLRGCLDQAAVVADAQPASAVDLLVALLATERGRDELKLTGDRIPNLLKAITASGDRAMVARVTQVIHELGEYGVGDYRELMPRDDAG
jgi:hypothetical protein